MSGYIDDVFDSTTQIRDVAREIGTVARALRIAGSRDLADEMYHLESQLYTASNKIAAAVAEDLNRTIGQLNVLGSAIEGGDHESERTN